MFTLCSVCLYWCTCICCINLHCTHVHVCIDVHVHVCFSTYIHSHVHTCTCNIPQHMEEQVQSMEALLTDTEVGLCEVNGKMIYHYYSIQNKGYKVCFPSSKHSLTHPVLPNHFFEVPVPRTYVVSSIHIHWL